MFLDVCRDCGNEFDPAQETKCRRITICDACWDRRGAIIKAAEEGRVSRDTFLKIQKKIGRGRGTAKAAIVKALAGAQP